MNKPYRRKKYFLETSFQGKYIFFYFIIAGIGFVLFSLVFSYLSQDTLSIIYDHYDLQIGKTPNILMNKILGTHLILLIFGGVCLFVFSMFITHRIAGPLFRIETTIDTMNHGDFTNKIFLRKNDECKELAEKINQLNELLCGKFNTTYQSICSIDDKLNSLEKNADTEAIKASVQDLKHLFDTLKF